MVSPHISTHVWVVVWSRLAWNKALVLFFFFWVLFSQAFSLPGCLLLPVQTAFSFWSSCFHFLCPRISGMAPACPVAAVVGFTLRASFIHASQACHQLTTSLAQSRLFFSPGKLNRNIKLWRRTRKGVEWKLVRRRMHSLTLLKLYILGMWMLWVSLVSFENVKSTLCMLLVSKLTCCILNPPERSWWKGLQTIGGGNLTLQFLANCRQLEQLGCCHPPGFREEPFLFLQLKNQAFVLISLVWIKKLSYRA